MQGLRCGSAEQRWPGKREIPSSTFGTKKEKKILEYGLKVWIPSGVKTESVSKDQNVK